MTSSSPTCLDVRVLGTRLRVWFRGHGRPMLLLHGGGPGTSSADWFDCMARLPAGIRCVAVDFPGFGESDTLPDGRPYTARSFADIVAGLIETLCLAPVTLVGHSMGAAVAALLACGQPALVRHLVLVAPGGGLYGIRDYVSPGLVEMARTTENPTRGQLQTLSTLLCHRPSKQEEQVERRLGLLANPSILQVQRSMQAERAADAQAAAASESRGLDMRRYPGAVTLVWAEEERFNPASLGPRILAALPPDTHYALVPEAGHNLQSDQPDVVAGILAGTR